MVYRLGLWLGLVVCFFSQSYAQTDTTYFAVRGNQVASRSLSRTYQVAQMLPNDTVNGIIRTYLTYGNRMIHEVPFERRPEPVRNGQERGWDSTGALIMQQDFTHGKPDGDLRVFFQNGSLRRVETYKDGLRTSGQCFDAAGNQVPFFEYYVSPRPNRRTNLRHYLSHRVRYTKRMKREGAAGVMLVSFIVNKAGAVSYVEIAKGLHPELDRQVAEAFNELPEGKSGYLDGRPHPFRIVLPLYFGHSGSTTNLGVAGTMGKVGANAMNVFLGPLVLPVAIVRSIRIRNESYQIEESNLYFEQPVYGARP